MSSYVYLTPGAHVAYAAAVSVNDLNDLNHLVELFSSEIEFDHKHRLVHSWLSRRKEDPNHRFTTWVRAVLAIQLPTGNVIVASEDLQSWDDPDLSERDAGWRVGIVTDDQVCWRDHKTKQDVKITSILALGPDPYLASWFLADLVIRWVELELSK